MNPTISISRQHASPYIGGSSSGGRSEGLRMPRFFKRYDQPFQHVRRLNLCHNGFFSNRVILVTCRVLANETHITRLFKFPQMDFEMAVWEMTSLLIAPKKVFRSMYYHVCALHLALCGLADKLCRSVS